MSMDDKLIQLLESFGFPVFLQGSLNKDTAYPNSFFTYWSDESVDGSHYDNDAISWVWSFSVYFYSVDPALVSSIINEQVRKLLKQNGFIVSGKGYDVASDEPTHTGRGIDALIIERNMEV